MFLFSFTCFRPGFYKEALSLSPSGNSSCSLPPSGAGIGGLGSVSIRPPIGSPGHSSFIGSRQAPGDCPPQQQQTPPQLGCSPPHPQQSVMIGSNYPDDKNVPQPLGITCFLYSPFSVCFSLLWWGQFALLHFWMFPKVLNLICSMQIDICYCANKCIALKIFLINNRR